MKVLLPVAAGPRPVEESCSSQGSLCGIGECSYSRLRVVDGGQGTEKLPEIIALIGRPCPVHHVTILTATFR